MKLKEYNEIIDKVGLLITDKVKKVSDKYEIHYGICYGNDVKEELLKKVIEEESILIPSEIEETTLHVLVINKKTKGEDSIRVIISNKELEKLGHKRFSCTFSKIEEGYKFIENI